MEEGEFNMSFTKRYIENKIYEERDKLKELSLTNEELVKTVSENTNIPQEIVDAYLGEH